MTAPQLETQTETESEVQNQQEDQSAVTPQFEAVPQQTTVEDLRNAYNQALRDASSRAATAEAELARLREQSNRPTPIDNEADKELLFNEPRKLIREEMQEQLKPLIDFQKDYAKNTELNRLVGLMENDPRYQLIKTPEVRSAFMQAMGPVQTVNESSAIAAYYMSVGTYVSSGGTINQQQNNTQQQQQQQQPNQTMQTIPPHSRPSAPVRTPPPGKAKARALTETEHVIRRANNMTEEEYLAEMDLSPEDVVKGPPKVEAK